MAGKGRIRKRFLDYMTYSWWKYAALVVICILGVDLLFAMTAYRVPEEKKIEVFVLNDFIRSEVLQEELWAALKEAYPEQEELTVQNINLASNDMYAYMQFSTYVSAQQGDVCLMPAGELGKLAAEGADHAFLELTPYIESGVIDPGDIDLTKGMMRSSEGVEGLYAIPADSLYGLLGLGNDPAGAVLCIFDYNGNDDPAAEVLGYMIRRYSTEKPEGYAPQTNSGMQSTLF